MALWRVQTAEGDRLARGPVEGGPTELLEGTLDGVLAAGSLDAPSGGPVPAGSVGLAPVEAQGGAGGVVPARGGSGGVGAAGVTYAGSRTARNEESGGHDFYDKVYDAE